MFDLAPTTACYIFWKNTDEDLMAFNRDQQFIFFNLAHYVKFCEYSYLVRSVLYVHYCAKSFTQTLKRRKWLLNGMSSKHFYAKYSSQSNRFLIMAHEIAHNGSLDHDEYHGSLTSRLVFTFLPTLHERFECFAGNAQSLQNGSCSPK